MLVLSRKQGESIWVGDDVEITVIDIGDNRVRLGINAPKGVPVHRQEVREAIERERDNDNVTG